MHISTQHVIERALSQLYSSQKGTERNDKIQVWFVECSSDSHQSNKAILVKNNEGSLIAAQLSSGMLTKVTAVFWCSFLVFRILLCISSSLSVVWLVYVHSSDVLMLSLYKR